MIEQRKLSPEELERLILEAPESEKKSLVAVCAVLKMTPYELFKRFAFDWDGVVDDGRPCYVAAIMASNKRFELWTVVNENVKQIALYRCAKRGLLRWSRYIPEIYATMMKSLVKNIAWTERLGFVPCHETNDTITFVFKNKEK